MNEYKKEMMWSHIYWLSMLGSAGSYTAAAKRLGVSKGAVSQRIAELEQASGIALVQRTTRSVRLTEAGQALVDGTRQAYASIEQGFDSIRDLAQVPRGAVRVTAPVALGRQKIIPLMGRFLQECPEVRIEIELSDHISSLAQEGFDLAIRHTSTVPETHVAWLLRPCETLLVATPGYLARHGKPRKPEDLSGHNCLYYMRSAASPAWSFEPARRKGERQSVAIKGNFCANNSEALREVVMADQGIALLPDFSAGEDVRVGRLVQLLPQWKPVGVFGDAIYAIRPYSAYVPRAVNAFVQYLKDRLREPGDPAA
ncbi:LysR family transcriptional regulator [Parapusillimonas granuli]|uniref:LysR family transcriptional regulator n=1 Tax=Parapusillimonas granuli TaxID=380911 RepID=A0A853G9D1_9BURK|nr:LysR family transcriptional regulator [Parapusillimonas granuli]MBB5214222.1 DNA-binding transcriptional LysR family regulator [Parapusillimonas granuli]NYT51326.1 LysR family transcriptional regulator [Parapusillimonas granuli]